ncbi:hypothetical protein JZU46_07085 [bacterium]|nr:hypothetical protein [bacterium]
MDFSVNLLSIQKALRVLNSVARPNAEDVSGQVVLDVRDNGDLILLCNNSSLALTHVISGCTVKVAGTTCVAYGKLGSFLNSFTPFAENVGVKDVKFKALKNDLSLSLDTFFSETNKSTHRLKLKLYPIQKMVVPTPFKNKTLQLNSGTLRLAIAKVIYAVNPASIRPFLQGVKVTFDDKFIYFAGTDAQMLSEYTTVNLGTLKSGSFTLPYSFIAALRKIIDADSEVYFDIDGGTIKAVVNSTTLHGNLLLGEDFPKYTDTFNRYTHEIIINKDIMLNSFVPCMTTLDADDHNRMTITIKDNKLFVNSEYAESEYSGDINFEGEFIADVNGNFLFQTLNAIMDDILKMKFSNNTGVLIFDSHQFENQKAILTLVRRK